RMRHGMLAAERSIIVTAHLRFRRVAKWAGLASLALLGMIWLTTARRSIVYLGPGRSFASAGGGIIRYGGPLRGPTEQATRLLHPPGPPLELGWSIEPLDGTEILPLVGLRLPIIDPQRNFGGDLTRFLIYVPIWFPFLLIALVTAYLWHSDRGRDPKSLPQS